MKNLKFISVTEENSAVFHNLMLDYAKELDEHQNRNTNPEILKKWTDSITQKQSDIGRCLRLCCNENEIIGFLYGKIDQPDDKGFKKVGYGYVMEFYVISGYRRMGFGKAMYLYLEDFFRENGVKNMYLTADPVTGKPFWEAMGFIGTGEISPENKQAVYEKSVSL